MAGETFRIVGSESDKTYLRGQTPDENEAKSAHFINYSYDAVISGLVMAVENRDRLLVQVLDSSCYDKDIWLD